MFDYKEIERTVNDNHLPFQKIGDVDKEILIQRLYDTFVIGNPRALWLSFKYVPYSIDCNMYNPQIQISAESGTKRSIFRQKNKTKRSKKRLHTTLIKPEQKVNEDLCSGFIVS